MTDPTVELPSEITGQILEISKHLSRVADAADQISPTAGWTSTQWNIQSTAFQMRRPRAIIGQLHELSDYLTTDVGTLPWRMSAAGHIERLINVLEDMLEMTERLGANPSRPELQRSARIWFDHRRQLNSILTKFGEDVVQTALNQTPPWPPYFQTGRHTAAEAPEGYPGPEYDMELVNEVIRPVNAFTVALLGIEIAVTDLVFSRATAPDDEFPLHFRIYTTRRAYRVEVYQDRTVISVWESGNYRGSLFPITERDLREQVVLILADVLVDSRQSEPRAHSGAIQVRR